MRLLNTTTHQLETFAGHAPLYAIFSHRWSNREITFQEVERDGPEDWSQDAYAKIRSVCSIAAANGLEYIWYDTCCIDKTSSSELSEAINSMYRWYREAVVCYAYLADVPEKEFGDSEWFERGWTLQELIAPQLVVFLNSSWEEIGTKSSLHAAISETTGIPTDILLTGNLTGASIAQKMSWAANRKTSVVEDRAYSLMGLFGVSMPMIYGEGEKAFVRLQEEILKTTDDLSIFVWKLDGMERPSGLLASCPSAFRHSRAVRRSNPSDVPAVVITNKGVQLTVPIITPKGRDPIALIHTDEEGKHVAIGLRPLSKTGEYFERKTAAQFFYMDQESRQASGDEERCLRRICVRQSRPPDERQLPLLTVAAWGRKATMALLLAHGLGVDSTDDTERAPLSWAAEHGNDEIVDFLLSRGAALELKDRSGMTPLLHAAKGGSTAAVRRLLNAGAALGSVDINGKSALSHAAARGHSEVAVLLLDEGANVEWRDSRGRTPLALAALNGHKDTIKVLLENKADIESEDSSRTRPLSHTASCGCLEAAKVLIEAGADLRSKDGTGWTALRYAKGRGHWKMVALLLENGAEEETDEHREKEKGDGRKEKRAMTGLSQPEMQKRGSGGLTDVFRTLRKSLTDPLPQASTTDA